MNLKISKTCKENEVHGANYANFQIEIPQINLWTFKKSEQQTENPEQPPPSNFEAQRHIPLEPQIQITNAPLQESNVSNNVQIIDINNIDYLNDNVNVEQVQNPLSELEQTHSAKSKTPFSDRFIQNNETDRVEFKNQRANTNTKRKINVCVNTFKTFLESVNSEQREIV